MLLPLPEVEESLPFDKVAFKAGKKNFLFMSNDGDGYNVIEVEGFIGGSSGTVFRPCGDYLRGFERMGGIGISAREVVASVGFGALD